MWLCRWTSSGRLSASGRERRRLDRLTASDIDSVGATYEYNGDGLRVTRTIDQTSVSYVWDVTAGLPAILQDSEGNTYVYGVDLISRTDNQGDQEYFTYDGLGSVTNLTDSDCAVDFGQWCVSDTLNWLWGHPDCAASGGVALGWIVVNTYIGNYAGVYQWGPALTESAITTCLASD